MDKNIPFFAKIQLLIVNIWIRWLNFWLVFLHKILFGQKPDKKPKSILIYKNGNIGDIICAIPSFIAIKEFYPDTQITLLTSPGKRGAIGAKDFLSGAYYFNEIKTYYSDEINDFKKAILFARKLKKEKYDLFIQLPDEWADFKTLFRNEIFAKIVSSGYAFGFELRSVQIFKKTQVDYNFNDKEINTLLDILERGGIKNFGVKFEFPKYSELSNEDEAHIKNLKDNCDILIGACMGGKTDDKKWSTEKYEDVLRELSKKYKIGVIFFGDISERGIINQVGLGAGLKFINFSGRSITNTILAIKKVRLFLTNDTGPMHIAAAFGVPIVALFGVRNVLGGWFPYGNQHKILYHKFINCDYKNKDCIVKSMDMISVGEVLGACDNLLMSMEQI